MEVRHPIRGANDDNSVAKCLPMCLLRAVHAIQKLGRSASSCRIRAIRGRFATITQPKTSV